jgi:hypothetical protein
MIELGSMPHLQSLTTSYIPYSFHGSILPQLLYLEATGPTLASQIDIDDLPGQIQVLKLYQYSLRQRRKTPASPRQFPNLYELALVDVSISDLLPGCIMAPKLENFHFGDDIEEEYLDPAPILQIFCSDGTAFESTSIRKLTIGGMELGPGIASYMRRLHNLHTLELFSCGIWRECIEPLWTSSGHTIVFLPSLRVLSLQHSEGIDGDDEFAEMREKCAAARPSLKVFIT